MAQRSSRLRPIDPKQRELHYAKEAILEDIPQGGRWGFVTESLIMDLYNEINILRSAMNSANIEVVIPVLHAFTNNGESILVNGIGAALEQPRSYDVVLLPDMSTLQQEYPQLLAAALRTARKRVIVGYYANSLKNRFENYLDSLNYHWMKIEEGREHYIIDKEPQIVQDNNIKEPTNGTTTIQRQGKQAE